MKSKRILAIVLSFAMVFSSVSFVFAEDLGEKIGSANVIGYQPLTSSNPLLGSASDSVIKIGFTNDVHGSYEDYSRVATFAKSVDILIDAGDNIQGSAAAGISKGEHMVAIMNKLGYTCAAVGNHEFDYGVDWLVNLMNEKAEYDVLSANIVDAKIGELLFEPYKIYDVKGTKIAFVGVTTPTTLIETKPTVFKNDQGEYMYDFGGGNDCADLYERVQSAIDEARADADYVILIAHVGEKMPADSTFSIYSLVGNLSGIDAAIDAHSHSLYNDHLRTKDGISIPVAETGAELENVGIITIDLKLKAASEEIIPLSNYDEDEEMLEYLAIIEEDLDIVAKQVVGTSLVDLSINDKNGKRTVRSSDSNAGQLVADAFKSVYQAEIGFINGGGVRADINKGDVTIADIMNMVPFANSITLAKIKGSILRDVLEYSVHSAPDEFGGYLQVSGITFDVNLGIKSPVVYGDNGDFAGVKGERRVSNIKVNGEPLDDNREYTVSSVDYILVDMGNGYSMLGPDKIEILRVGEYIDQGAVQQYILFDLENVIGEEYATVEDRVHVKYEEAKEQTYDVVKGDCLWNIAKKLLGSGSLWKQIYEANKDIIKNPNLIYVGQTFVIPMLQ